MDTATGPNMTSSIDDREKSSIPSVFVEPVGGTNKEVWHSNRFKSVYLSKTLPRKSTGKQVRRRSPRTVGGTGSPVDRRPRDDSGERNLANHSWRKLISSQDLMLA